MDLSHMRGKDMTAPPLTADPGMPGGAARRRSRGGRGGGAAKRRSGEHGGELIGGDVDLCFSSDDEDAKPPQAGVVVTRVVRFGVVAAPAPAPAPAQTAAPTAQNGGPWTCRNCTLINHKPEVRVARARCPRATSPLSSPLCVAAPSPPRRPLRAGCAKDIDMGGVLRRAF